MKVRNINPRYGDKVEYDSLEEYRTVTYKIEKEVFGWENDWSILLKEGIDYELSDSDAPVFLVNKKGEIERTTRGEVREMLQEPMDRNWDSDELIRSLDNAGLIDFETLEDAKRHVSELPKEED